MRPDPIDSTQNLLDPPQILIEFLQRYDAGVPMQAALLGLAQELGMDDAESIQFGNTAFISHYDEDESLVFMRALNVDTAANFIDNIENYVSYVYRRGIKTIVTNYSDAAITSAIKAVHQRISQNNVRLRADLGFEQEDDQTVATITLAKDNA